MSQSFLCTPGRCPRMLAARGRDTQRRTRDGKDVMSVSRTAAHAVCLP